MFREKATIAAERTVKEAIPRNARLCKSGSGGILFLLLFWCLVRHDSLALRNKFEDQILEILRGELELPGEVDRPGRARLGAEPAVHALGLINVELGEQPFLRSLVLFGDDLDAVDRTIGHTGETGGADLHVYFEETAKPLRQHLLQRPGDPVRILDRDRPSEQMRKGDRHSLEDSRHGLKNVDEIGHISHTNGFRCTGTLEFR